jgi:excisionase family DNA binding protein
LTKTCSTREAAKILGVSHRTVQLWVESGQLRAWKTVGGHRRIYVSSLDNFISSRLCPAISNKTLKKSQRNNSIAHRSIFICDSDQNMRVLFRKYTNDWRGVRWEFFESNLEALIEIGARNPDILISEICTSGIDILYMIKTLSANPISCNMKIILTSDLSENTLKALAFPPEIRILRKPFSSDEFVAEINSVLGELPSSNSDLLLETSTAR